MRLFAIVSVPPKKSLTPATGGVNPPFGSLTLLWLIVLLVSVSVPPEFEIPPTAALKAVGPPGALALFPLTVLFVSVTLLPQQRFMIPPTAVSKGAVALALFTRTVLSTSARLPPWLKIPPTPLWNWGTV